MIISTYSLNYPAIASIITLVGVGLYHLFMSRRQEFDTAIFPSNLQLNQIGPLQSLQSEKDISINCPMTVDSLICRDLYLGPKAVLHVRTIQAERIVVDGEIAQAEHVFAKVHLVNNREAKIHRIVTPKIILNKRSHSVIQLVPKGTEVISKKGAQAKGFFSSHEELQSHHRTGAKQLSQPTLSNVHPIRKKI